MRFSWRTGAALLAACVVSVGGSVAAAQASSGIISVIQVSSPPDNLGLLSVKLNSTTPVDPSSISAAFYATASSTPAYTATNFVLASGSSNAGGGVSTWQVGSPITTSELPLGIYSVTISAADTGGDTVTDPDAYSLQFLERQAITLSVSPDGFSYGQQVTLTGTDTGTFPDGSTQAVKGQKLELLADDNESFGPTVTTDGSGDFSLTVTAGVTADLQSPVAFWSSGTATTAEAFSPETAVTIAADPIRVTDFSVSPATASFGQPVIVSGALSMRIQGTWLPYADLSVSTDYLGVNQTGCTPGNCSDVAAMATTGDDGSFTMKIPGGMGSNIYDLDTPGYGLPWFTSTVPDYTVRVDHVPTHLLFQQSTVQRDTKGRLHLVARISPAGTFVDQKAEVAFPPATFQYATHPGGPWKTVPRAGSVFDRVSPPAHPRYCYRTVVAAPAGAGYVRALTHASTAYLGAYSQRVRVIGSVRPHFRRFAVSPRSLASGHTVNVRGQVSGVPDATIQVIFKVAGSSRWQVLRTLESDGFEGTSNWVSFSGAVTVRRSGQIAVRFQRHLYAYGAQSASVHVTVR
jgi:hypothetical protein